MCCNMTDWINDCFQKITIRIIIAQKKTIPRSSSEFFSDFGCNFSFICLHNNILCKIKINGLIYSCIFPSANRSSRGIQTLHFHIYLLPLPFTKNKNNDCDFLCWVYSFYKSKWCIYLLTEHVNMNYPAYLFTSCPVFFAYKGIHKRFFIFAKISTHSSIQYHKMKTISFQRSVREQVFFQLIILQSYFINLEMTTNYLFHGMCRKIRKIFQMYDKISSKGLSLYSMTEEAFSKYNVRSLIFIKAFRVV